MHVVDRHLRLRIIAVIKISGYRMRRLRISHPAIFGSRSAETIHFYCDLLGVELVLRQDNLDVPWEEHLFFHVGNDNFIAYFVPKEGAPELPPAQSGSGHMDHLAIDVDTTV